jgi:enolase
MSAMKGGFAPNLASTNEALDFIMKSIEKAGYTPGDDVAWRSMRCFRVLQERQVRAGRRGQVALVGRKRLLYRRSLRNYPIISIEDGMAEDDWDGWKILTEPSATSASLSATTCS